MESLAQGAWIGVLLGAVLFALIVFVIRSIRRTSHDEADVSAGLLQAFAPEDNLLKYVDVWRAYWVRMARQKGGLYHTLTAVALIATSLVTAVGAFGSLPFVTVKEWWLVATTFLGLIATISTGMDRMLNNGKDYIRFRRYATLLDVAQLRYVAAMPVSNAAADTAARKAFIEMVCKLRGDETSDWIQDVTSATVDSTSPGNADPHAAEIARATHNVKDAEQKVTDAQTAFAAADSALQIATAELGKRKTAGDPAAVAQAQQDVADKQAAVESAKTDLKAVQDDLQKRKDALDKLVKQPRP